MTLDASGHSAGENNMMTLIRRCVETCLYVDLKRSLYVELIVRIGAPPTSKRDTMRSLHAFNNPENLT